MLQGFVQVPLMHANCATHSSSLEHSNSGASFPKPNNNEQYYNLTINGVFVEPKKYCTYIHQNMDHHLFQEGKCIYSALFRLCIVILKNKDCLCTRRYPHNHVKDLLYIQVDINILEDHSVYIVH